MFTANQGLSPKKMERVEKAIRSALKGKTLSNCSCQKGKRMKTKTRKKDSRKTDLIRDIIIANVGWTKDEKPLLKSMDTKALKKILLLANQQKKAGKKNGKILNSRKKKVRSKDAKARKSLKARKALANEGKNVKKTLKRYMNDAPDEIREILSNGLAAHAAQRERYVDIIISNEASEFTKKELRNDKVFPLKRLKKLARLAVANAGQDRDDDEDDVYSDFLGAAGAPLANQSRGREDDVPALVAPGFPVNEEREEYRQRESKRPRR